LDRLARSISARLLANSRELGVAGCLLLLTLGVYVPVRHFDFVNVDDRPYVSRNDHVMAGLTWDGLRWALTSTQDANWFPLTRLSLMADRQLFGPREDLPPSMVNAGPYHWTNVILHAASALLLFGFLRWITGALWPSALVAFLFAMHPQHVESVAWVAERKDVLSMLFWMLALWSYAAYAKRPKAGTYLLTLLLYCLGFMAKPMVVTLPVVLLLLDVWPLRRFPGRSPRRLILEKAPFLAPALAMSAVTFAVQRAGGAVRTIQQLSLGLRLENAVISAAIYIGKTVWPTRLAFFYPFPAAEPLWQAIAAGVVLVSFTVLAVVSVRTRPYLAVGWFWYVITVLPVIGIVQVGEQTRADRYTYLPTIGLFIMLAWSGADWWQRRPKVRPFLAGLCGVACVACMVLTWRQISYWKNSETLFQHALEVTDRNCFRARAAGEELAGARDV
jgi:protein O-mannosyl-transferase